MLDSRELDPGRKGLVLASLLFSQELDPGGEASCWPRAGFARTKPRKRQPRAGLVLASRELDPGGEGLVLACCYSRENWAREGGERLVLAWREVNYRSAWDHLQPFCTKGFGPLVELGSPVCKTQTPVL